MIIALASALACVTVQGMVLCEEADPKVFNETTLVAALQRKCMSSVPPLARDKYPGGFMKLFEDCEKAAKNEAKAVLGKATRTVDQNGVQR